MRLGFTTSIFARPLATGEVNLGGLVDFAEEQGFVAIELRDEDAAYRLGDVQDFVKDTSAKSIEVTYVIKNDMLAPGDEALFRRGIERAALCGDGAILRILAGQSALAPAEKKGYTRAEVETLARICINYAKIAEEKGIYIAVEHAKEPLYGDGDTYFGLADLLQTLEATGIPANFGVTFDPANAVYTALCKAPTTPDKVFEFLDTQSRHITLVHLKTTHQGKTTPTLQDADIENETLFSKLSKAYDGIICMEIPPPADLAECRKNIDSSLDYLRKQGLMGYFA